MPLPQRSHCWHQQTGRWRIWSRVELPPRHFRCGKHGDRKGANKNSAHNQKRYPELVVSRHATIASTAAIPRVRAKGIATVGPAIPGPTLLNRATAATPATQKKGTATASGGNSPGGSAASHAPLHVGWLPLAIGTSREHCSQLREAGGQLGEDPRRNAFLVCPSRAAAYAG